MGAKTRPNLSEYTSKFIRHKANQLVGHYGISRSGREDIEQDLIVHLLQRMDRYDPKRASERTFASRVVNHKIVSIIRHRRAAQRDNYRVACSIDEPTVDEHGLPTDQGQTLASDTDRRLLRQTAGGAADTMDLSIDLRRVLDGLEPDLCRLCERLICESIAEIARTLGVSRDAIYRRIDEVRQHFTDAGLNNYLATRPDSSSRDGVSKQ